MEVRHIPGKLLNAALNKPSYFDLHREYTYIYNLSDKDAWEKLEDDLEFYGLPHRYNSDRCFYSARHNLIRVNTKC